MTRSILPLGFLVLVGVLQVFAQNAIVEKVQCVTDTMDAIAKEHDIDNLWQDIQQKLLKNINTLFGCLKYNGFKLQRSVFVHRLNVGFVFCY